MMSLVVIICGGKVGKWRESLKDMAGNRGEWGFPAKFRSPRYLPPKTATTNTKHHTKAKP